MDYKIYEIKCKKCKCKVIKIDSKLEINYKNFMEYLIHQKDSKNYKNAYEYLLNFINANIDKFSGSKTGQIYGKIYEGRAYIINNVFNEICKEKGYNSKDLLNYLKSENLIFHGDRTTTIIRINNIPTRCVSLKLIPEM